MIKFALTIAVRFCERFGLNFDLVANKKELI